MQRESHKKPTSSSQMSKTIMSPRPRRASFRDLSQSPRTVAMGSPRFERRRRSYSLEIRNWQGQLQSSLGLQSSDIIMILQDVIPRFSQDRELIAQSRHHCQRILAANTIEVRSLSGDELEDVVSVLNVFIDSSPALPPALVGAVHSTIGSIRMRQRFYDCSIESFQKALWIKNSARELPDEIGLALHRLGLAYYRNGERAQACCVLNKALVKYEEANWGKNHPFVQAAKEKLGRHLDSPSSLSPSLRGNSPIKGRGDLKSAGKDWRSLPSMPVLR